MAIQQNIRYQVVWENQHGERYFSDITTNSTTAIRIAREAVKAGKRAVRITLEQVETGE